MKYVSNIKRCIGVCLSVLIVILSTETVWADSFLETTDSKKNIVTTVDEYIKEFVPKSTVGVEVAIVMNDESVYQKAYGYADYEKEEMLKENQVMEWGSVTKLFTWISIMQLVEKGDLNLDIDARSYLSDEFVKKARLADVQEFSLLELMNHTAGFEDQIVDLGLSSADQVMSLEGALINSSANQVYEPGTVMAYSNYGAALAGYIVEVVTDMDFYKYVQTNILDVLGMKDTTIKPHKDEKLEALKPLGYFYQGDENFSTGTWTYVSLYPCGSLNSTMKDMKKFATALLPPKGKKSPLFNKRSTLDSLFKTTYTIREGKAGVAHGFFEYDENHNVYMHNGNTICFSSIFALDIEERTAVMIVSNQSNEANVVNGLLDVLLDDNEDIPAPKQKIDFDNLSWSNTYVPARWVNDGYLRILRESAFMTLKDVNKNAVVFTQLGIDVMFEHQDGDYIYEGDEVILGITDNKVTHFKLGDIEYVPAEFSHTGFLMISSIVVLLVCVIYFLISVIAKIILFIKKRCSKECCDIIDICKFFISLTVLVISVNNVCLYSNSVPWPISSKVVPFIVLNIIFAIALLGEICYYFGWKIIKDKKYSVKNVLPVVMGLLLLGTMLYWNLFFIS